MTEKERFFECVASGQTDRTELMKLFPHQLVERWRMCALRRYREKC